MKTRSHSENIKITPEEFHIMNSEEKILKMAGGLIPPAGKPEEAILESILKKTTQNNRPKIIRFRTSVRVAAAIIILLLSVYTINNYFSKERVIAKFGEQSEVILPDGTEVILNAGSKISWNKNDFTENRHLNLKGEAFFDVEKGSRFVIDTKNGKVEILGTQLNVFSRDDKFWVSCISGKVRLTANNEQQIILPGEIAERTPTGLKKYNITEINKTTSWKDGIFHFEETPLVRIFEALERQFNVSVVFKGNSSRLLTVDFSNESINEALDVVCIPMELNYEIRNNKKVTIREKQ